MQKSEPKEPHTLPFLILGNKIDEDNLRKVSREEATRFCDENGFIFYETSAKDNLNIEDAFKTLTLKVIERQERLNNKILGESDTGSASGDKKQAAVVSNTSRRMTRSTKTRVQLNEHAMKQAQGGNKQCCK